MIASTFKKYADRSDVLVFASGVANSNETTAAAFERETELLDQRLQAFDGLVVYFGSLFDPTREKTAYAIHKHAMEARVAASARNHLVFKLPQVVGPGANPRTLTQFIADHIRKGEPFPVERDATRVLIDAEDMATLCDHFISDRTLWNQTVTIAPPPAVPVLAIVQELECLLRLESRHEIVDGGQPFPYVSPEIASLGRRLGLAFGPDYYGHVLGKHYG